MEIYFVTSNKEKFEVAERVLNQIGIRIRQIKFTYPEVQAESLGEIVKFSLKSLSKKLQKLIIIEDSGLFIEALNGFPGPYSSYVQRTIGPKGILKLMNGIINRKAEFKSIVGLWRPKSEILMFEGVVKGKITTELRGKRGYGYDLIFVPNNANKTFAEMGFEEMVKFSDWGRSFTKFGKWYIEHSHKS